MIDLILGINSDSLLVAALHFCCGEFPGRSLKLQYSSEIMRPQLVCRWGNFVRIAADE